MLFRRSGRGASAMHDVSGRITCESSCNEGDSAQPQRRKLLARVENWKKRLHGWRSSRGEIVSG